MKVSMVIPNWNGRKKLEQNLPRVLKLKGLSEIIVVDDDSSDDSVAFLRQNYPDVKLITKDKNSGFSSTVNTGVNHTKGEIIFLLNSDAVPEVDCLNPALSHFQNPQIFSVGFNTGGSWSWANFKDGYFWHYQSTDITNQPHQTLWASGGSGLFHKDIWNTLLGFDEMFDPFYEEDVDLGYRATKRGYKNIWEPNAHVEHYKQTGVISEHFKSEFVSGIAQRNQLLFIWKNITSPKLIKAHRQSLMKKLIVHPKYWQVFIQAISKMPQALSKRSVERNQAKISDEQILEKFS